ncbi:MAG: MotA/TolQ/ExbB proton channel family protein [Deltaproteobacteria bacterium]|nr:MotA/TolQ/ExbB proton channel family protein [Deltaproteobacteria bacterium]
MFQDLSVLALLQKGGITVVVLALLSVLSIAITLERAWAFSRFAAALRDSFSSIRDAMKDGGLLAVSAVCRAKPSPLSEVLLSGLSRSGRSKEEVNEAMELAGRRELLKLEKSLGILGTIGSTAPFIGLFGTVLGIIRAFSDLAIAQGASPAAVADGIAEALIATAAGLFVAVPAVVAYNYFVRAASRHALELEASASEFTSRISEGS